MCQSKKSLRPIIFSNSKLLLFVSLVFAVFISNLGNAFAQEEIYEHSVEIQEYSVRLTSRTWVIRTSNTIGGMEMIINNRLDDPLYFTTIDGRRDFELNLGEYDAMHCVSQNEVSTYSVQDSRENYYQLSLHCGDVVVIREGF